MRELHTRIPAYRTYVADDRLRHVKRLARLMDSEFQVPGTRLRFGLDPIIGLVPGIGNLATFAVSAMLAWTMMQYGASGHVKVRMALNIMVDAVIGAIPILGNIFDFVFRANDRNVELLRKHYEEGEYQGSGRGLAALVLLGVLVFVVAAGWGLWLAFDWAWREVFGAI